MAKAIKLDSDLWRRVEEHVKKAGYSSAEEFVEHAIEKELARNEAEEEETQHEIDRRLKGLGYLE